MSEYMKSFTTFAGSDLVVSFGLRPIGELQSIAWGVQREKAPVYTLGNPDPRSFSRGKRGIAGNLVFAVLDRDALMEEMKTQLKTAQGMPVMYTAAGNAAAGSRTSFLEALSMSQWNERASKAGYLSAKTPAELKSRAGTIVGDATRTAQGDYEYTRFGLNSSNANKPVEVPLGFDLITANTMLYADTLPPFDVTCTFANEYGQAAYMRILDVDILNDGSGASVDTVVMAREMTFIARRLSPIMTGAFTNSGVDALRAPGS